MERRAKWLQEAQYKKVLGKGERSTKNREMIYFSVFLFQNFINQ